MRRKLLATSMALAVGLATAACATTSDTEMGATGNEPTGNGSTIVEVTNNHPQLVTVEAVSSGFDERLGDVASNETERFELPSGVSGADLRIQVDPIGSTESYLSPRVSAAGNDVITVTVEANLGLTTVAVR